MNCREYRLVKQTVTITCDLRINYSVGNYTRTFGTQVSTAETTMQEWKTKSDIRKLHCFDLTTNKLPPVGIYASQRRSFCGYDEHLIKTNGFSIYGQLTEQQVIDGQVRATYQAHAWFPNFTTAPVIYQTTVNGVSRYVVRSPEFPPLENDKAIATWKNLNNCLDVPNGPKCRPVLSLFGSISNINCYFDNFLKLGDNAASSFMAQTYPGTGTVTVNIAVAPLT